MDESQPRVTELLERAGGPVDAPTVDRLVAAGRRRVRNRRLTQGLTTFAVVAAVLGTVLPLTLSPAARRGPTPGVTESPASSMAFRLAHGSWRRVPDPPFARCSDEAFVGTGDGLALVQPQVTSCAAAAALYDARTNSWRSIAAPPSFLDPQQALVWSGSDLLALPAAGTQPYIWLSSANTWRPLPALPADFGTPVGAIWWHGSWLAVSSTGRFMQATGLSWRRLPGLPAPPGYHPHEPILAEVDGRLFAAVTDTKVVNHGRETTVFSRPAVLTRVGSRWQRMTAARSLPLAPMELLPLGAGVLVVGTSCPPGGRCPATADQLAVRYVGNGGAGRVSDLSPPHPLGPLAVASTGQTLASVDPDPRHGTQLYDAPSGTWFGGPELSVPQNVATSGDGGVVWTDSGVVVLAVPPDQLRHPGRAPALSGFILRPAA